MMNRLVRMVAVVLSWCVVMGQTVVAGAVDTDVIAQDFKPVDGFVVMAKAGEYIIDLDAEAGVSVGDLFNVIQPGEKIIHPVTGKALGRLEETKGFLKVVRLKTGYAFARPFGDGRGIKVGDPIRRFDGIAALFWDYTEAGKPLFFELRRALPAMKWQDYASAQTQKPDRAAEPVSGIAALYFILRADGLEVRDPEFEVIHTYPSIQLPSSATRSVVPAGPGASGLSAGNATARSMMGAEVSSSGSAAYSPSFQKFKFIGELPGLTVMSDFLNFDDRLLMATTDGAAVNVFAVSAGIIPVATQGRFTARKILAVKWWRPPGSEVPYLAVTYWADDAPEADIFALHGRVLKAFKERLPFMLGTFDRDADGLPETLLRQSFDRETFWGSQIREIHLTGGELETVKPDFVLPRRFTVLGSLFADLTGDGQMESFFVRGRILYVHSGRKLRYSSASEMGGSLSGVTYDLQPGAKQTPFQSSFVEVCPVAMDLDGDHLPELISVASDRAVISVPGIGAGVQKSWLAVLEFRDGNFVSGTLGEELETPIQGLAVDSQRVLLVNSDPGSVFKKASSRLLAYPLAR